MSEERMLINATQSEEIRVALVKNNYLYDLDIDCPSETKKKGNIYFAVVTRREPSLDAVFVEYGAKRQGFLPFKEIAPEYFKKSLKDFGDEKPPITSLIREGQQLLIQVDKEERGNKGAALTTFITLAGCYLVLMPNNPNSGGISRRIEGDDRDELRETLNALTLPDGMGLIIRTAGVGKGQDDLQADLNMLCNQWQAIRQACTSRLAPCLIHQEGDVIIRSIRDNLRTSVGEIVIDDHSSYVKARHYIEQVKPDFLPNLKLYNSAIPLFNFYQIESQIETAYQREVLLPSGGALVIDRAEALVSIDINSAKSTSGGDIETTAFNTNLEAANEIARQLRLRDLAGLVVIDFIDMNLSKHQREVEAKLKEALKADRARIQVGRISRFGLLEMSRQRLRLSLGEAAQEVCSSCEGRGTVRSIQSHSLSIIRLIEEEALKDKTAEVHVQLPVEIATYVINEKREFILNIEKRHSVHVIIIANPYLRAPKYSIVRIKEENRSRHKEPSFSLIQPPEFTVMHNSKEVMTSDEPAVKAFSDSAGNQLTDEPYIKRLWKKLYNFYHTQNSSPIAASNALTDDNKSQAIKSNAQTAIKSNDKPARPNNIAQRRRKISTNNHQVNQHNHSSPQHRQIPTSPGQSTTATSAQAHQQRRRQPQSEQRTVTTNRPDNNKKKESIKIFGESE